MPEDKKENGEVKPVNRPLIYIPKDAKINLSNSEQNPPQTKYNSRVKVFNIDAIKKLLKGNYGRND